MRVGVATDHGGFELKEDLKSWLSGAGHVVVDMGARELTPAHQGVEHDDMNILCMGGRVVGPLAARDLIDAFLGARFTGEERHKRRLGKVAELDAAQRTAELSA